MTYILQGDFQKFALPGSERYGEYGHTTLIGLYSSLQVRWIKREIISNFDLYALESKAYVVRVPDRNKKIVVDLYDLGIRAQEYLSVKYSDCVEQTIYCGDDCYSIYVRTIDIAPQFYVSGGDWKKRKILTPF